MIRNNPKLILSFLIFSSTVYGQLDSLKWAKTDNSFEKPDQFKNRNYSFESENAGGFLKKTFVNVYWFFISDVDGDNCPFHPSCSSFFIDATEETNIFQGTLMFSDRLVRDFNWVKTNHYPQDVTGDYYDPPINYTLNKNKIKYLPPTFIVDDE